MKKFWKYILSGFNYKHYYKPKYLVNSNPSSNEIHLLSRIKDRCVRYMKEYNKLYMSQYDLDRYMETHPYANGCYHCNRDMDTDVRKVKVDDKCVHANEYVDLSKV